MPDAWSRAEVEATVADYFTMFQAELRGDDYNKAAHNRALASGLNGRSHSAIEKKHQNISAIFNALGYPGIPGYKPLRNYQRLLYEVVADRLAADDDLTELVKRHVTQPAFTPSITDILDRLAVPPEAAKVPRKVSEHQDELMGIRRGVNYLALEAQNASLGRAGEDFVMNYERAILIHAGKEALADKVEHVAVTLGDGAGYDIRSFEPSGSDRFVEVKTTAYGKSTPFFVSRKELKVSGWKERAYHLHRVFGFRKDPHLFIVNGPLNVTCDLDPSQFQATIA